MEQVARCNNLIGSKFLFNPALRLLFIAILFVSRHREAFKKNSTKKSNLSTLSV